MSLEIILAAMFGVAAVLHAVAAYVRHRRRARAWARIRDALQRRAA